MASMRTRLIDSVVAELQTLTQLKFTGKDLFGFEQLTGEKFPAAFVIAGSGGTAQLMPGRRVREIAPLQIIGYVKVDTGSPDGVMKAREDFFQLVFNKLTGTGMEDRLRTDMSANGQNGAIPPLQPGGVQDTDEGQVPPYGYFNLSMSAILHYAMGAL